MFQRDVDALRTKLNDLREEGETLGNQFPSKSQTIHTLMVELDDMLQELVFAVVERRQKLEQSLKLQQFLSEYRNVR